KALDERPRRQGGDEIWRGGPARNSSLDEDRIEAEAFQLSRGREVPVAPDGVDLRVAEGAERRGLEAARGRGVGVDPDEARRGLSRPLRVAVREGGTRRGHHTVTADHQRELPA